MKNSTRPLAGAALAVGLLPFLHGCGSGDQPTAESPSSNGVGNTVAAAPDANAAPGSGANAAPGNAASGAAATGFKVFTPSKSGASVLMPASATEQPLGAQNGLMADVGDDTYMFVYSDSDDPKAAADKFQKDATPGATVKSGPTNIMIDGHEGTDTTMLSGSTHATTQFRTVIVGKKLYEFMTTNSNAGVVPLKTKEIFDSLKLTGAK